MLIVFHIVNHGQHFLSGYTIVFLSGAQCSASIRYNFFLFQPEFVKKKSPYGFITSLLVSRIKVPPLISGYCNQNYNKKEVAYVNEVCPTRTIYTLDSACFYS